MVSRTPYAETLRVLREEVGFHCPVDVDGDICGSPYLTWHHFDPPWRDEQHHRPEGMIALCREHADKADHGSCTDDQLRRFKTEGRGRGREVSGRFDWMRRELVAVVGGVAYVRTPTLIEIAGRKAVWLGRNPYDELLLNFDMPTLSGQPRASIRDNTWVVPPTDVTELVCPPSGKHLRVRYSNGDLFEVQFLTASNRAALCAGVPAVQGLERINLEFPATIARVSQIAAGSILQLTPQGTLVGTNQFWGCLMADCGVGIAIGEIAPPPATGAISAGHDAVAELLRQARQLPGYRG